MKLNHNRIHLYRLNPKKWIQIVIWFQILFLQCIPHLEGKENIEKLTIPTKEGNIFTLTNDCHSKSKLLVFVHGSPGNGSDFLSYMLDKDFQTHFCMLSPDRLGFGYSKQEEFIPSVTTQGKAISEMIQSFVESQKLSVTSITIVGHSYGGPVAMKSFLLCNESLKKDGKVFLLSAPMDPMYEELRFYNHLAKNVIIEWILPKSWVRSNEEMFQLKQDLIGLALAMKQSQFPVVMIHGDSDGLVPWEHTKFLKHESYKGDSKVYLLSGGSHFIPWTRFSEIKSILFKEVSQ
ncbi:alpha/beta hydrolase [Leptospira levettii]|uniref:alpha/beta fold hydrolase n=1 Tax=Leptospira levettii TaxID=2023178 RepID=UPI0010835C3C|nr:alpha/beta hydrolase [Leptospira levettii]TGL22081.1 alpha/beta hydrolase [Leptospira levettii]